MDSTQPIVREELVERCLGDEAFAAEMLGLFASNTPGVVAQIKTHAQAGRWEEAGRAAHTLKGTAGNIAAPDLRGAAIAFEDAIRSGDTARAEASLPRVEMSFAKALAYANVLGESMVRKAA